MILLGEARPEESWQWALALLNLIGGASTTFSGNGDSKSCCSCYILVVSMGASGEASTTFYIPFFPGSLALSGKVS